MVSSRVKPTVSKGVVDDMYEMTPDVLKNFSDLEPDFGKESIL
jgi:hypothetical protein